MSIQNKAQNVDIFRRRITKIP